MRAWIKYSGPGVIGEAGVVKPPPDVCLQVLDLQIWGVLRVFLLSRVLFDGILNNWFSPGMGIDSIGSFSPYVSFLDLS